MVVEAGGTERLTGVDSIMELAEHSRGQPPSGSSELVVQCLEPSAQARPTQAAAAARGSSAERLADTITNAMPTQTADETPTQATDAIPTQEAILEKWGPILKSEKAEVYQKIKMIHAKIAEDDGIIETVVGDKEGEHSVERRPYSSGHYIMLASDGVRRYPLSASLFGARYSRDDPHPTDDETLSKEGFYMYKPLGMIWAYKLSTEEARGFFPARQLMGQWGKTTLVGPGDFLAMPYPDGGEVSMVIDPATQKHTYPDVQQRAGRAKLPIKCCMLGICCSECPYVYNICPESK